MKTVKNTTDEEICVRTGKDHTEYVFYFVPSKESIEVENKEAKAIAKRIKEAQIVGVVVSKHLEKPLQKSKTKEAKGEEASSEIS